MAPKGRGGRGGRGRRGGRGGRGGRGQNNPAVPDPNPTASGSNPSVPDPNLAASGSNPSVPDPNLSASGSNPTVPDPNLAASGSNPTVPDPNLSASGSNPAPSGSDPDVPNPAASGSNLATRPRREFPRNVIFDILKRLPVKSVLRFAIASKSWRTVVSLPAFKNAHLNRSPAALLLHGQNTQSTGDVAYVFRPPNPESRKPDATTERINFPAGSYGVAAQRNVVVGAAPNGVVCITHDRFAEKITLWNPATGSSLGITVPKTPSTDDLMGASVGFGFDPDSKRYAIVRIVRYIVGQRDVAYIFNFKNGRWSSLGGVNFKSVSVKCDAVVNGVPYWKARELVGIIVNLVWFDVNSSTFHSDRFGWDVEPERKELQLSEIRAGQLGAIVWEKRGNLEDRFLEVWTRATNGLWSQTYLVSPTSLPVLGKALGFFGEVEIVQEIVAENGIPALYIIKLTGNVGEVELLQDVRGQCSLDGMSPNTCEVMRYKKSLTRLPKIDRVLI